MDYTSNRCTMNNKAIISIAVVAILIVAGIGAVLVGNHDNGKDNSGTANTLGCKLRVLGNANQDNYLDSKDIDAINDIINGKTIWNRETNPLADANNDGIIDSNDIALVKKFINGESATMYYLDWNNSVSSVPYPLTSYLGNTYGILTGFSTGLDIGYILGIESSFTYMCSGDINASQLDTTLYPTAASMKSVSMKTPDIAALYADNVRVIMGDERFVKLYQENAEAAGMTIIKLPENRTLNGVDSMDTLITMGAMCNLQDKTASYIDFMEKTTEKIQKAIEKASVKTKSYIIPYTAPGYLPEIYVDAHGTASQVLADVSLLEKLPVSSKITTTAADGFDVVTAAELVALNPEIFVCSMFAYASDKDVTYQQYVDAFKDFVKTGFDKSNAQIFALPFEDCSLAGLATVLVLASMIWPDSFDSEDAWNTMQEYFDNFTRFSGDIRNSKFAPLSYSALQA